MIGWIQLSRQAVAQAEQALHGDERGVRDEIGFLVLHQAFADHFFPGTSVLHTRLKYALFVPWLIQASGGDEKKLNDLELRLQMRLAKADPEGGGVIGGSLKNRLPAQPASTIYWSSLARWEILAPQVSGASGRRALLSRLALAQRKGKEHRGDDGDVDIAAERFFDPDMPACPASLLTSETTQTFKLLDDEREFLQRKLSEAKTPDGQHSLLARMVQRRGEWKTNELDEGLGGESLKRCASEEDQERLAMAVNVASLAGIGRAVYAALVETLRENDRQPPETTHRDHLLKFVEEHAEQALAVDVQELSSSVPNLHVSKELMTVLARTQEWLKHSHAPRLNEKLEEAYRRAEVRRKGVLARLATSQAGATRRREWTPQGHALAEPLHYRWRNVKRMLSDLRAGA
ncbi:MAG: hypothetical protein KA803_12375 [Rhodoferax sp.]|nr:hypothetical protein [Rhodoferax sp.]